MNAAGEKAAGIAFILWWIGLIHLPIVTGGPDFRIVAGPVFTQYYWPILALLSVRLVQNLIAALQPRWTLVTGLLNVATTIGMVALAAMIYRAGHWATVVATGMPAAQAAQIETSLNLALKIAIVVVGIILLWQGAVELWRLYRARREQLGDNAQIA